MKITFILPGYPAPIGGFRAVYEYANQLVGRGHRVTVIHARYLRNVDPPPNMYRWLRRKVGNLLTKLSKPNLRWLVVDERVRMLYVREPLPSCVPDGDVVFATAWQTAEYVVDYQDSKGHKFYLIMDFPPYMGPEEKIESSWEWAFKKVTISRWLYDKVVSVAGTEDLVNIPIGIDSSRFKMVASIDGRPSRVLMMYSPGKYKGAEDGIRALEICKARHPNMRATVFGKVRRPRQIPSWIEYRHNVPEGELTRLYNQAKIFLCSSLAEGFALPPAEAMACGCAIVSTDCGGNREYAEDNVTALLSSPGDPWMLADNVVRLLEDDGLRTRLAKAGHERIQGFTWERSTNLLEQFLDGKS